MGMKYKGKIENDFDITNKKYIHDNFIQTENILASKKTSATDQQVYSAKYINDNMVADPETIATTSNINTYLSPYDGRCTINDATIIKQGALYNMKIRFIFTTKKATWAGNTEWLNLFTITDAFKAIAKNGCQGNVRDPQNGNYGASISYSGGIAVTMGIWPWKQISSSSVASLSFDAILTWVNA